MEWTRAGGAPLAVCIPHFAKLLSAIEDGDLVRDLIERQATLLERLSDDMERHALKYEAVRRFLVSEEEENAAQRALSLMVGHRSLRVGSKHP